MFKGRSACNIIHHFERDKRHGFRFVSLLKIVLEFFLSDRMVCQYFSDWRRARLATQSNLFLYKTEVAALTSMQM